MAKCKLFKDALPKVAQMVGAEITPNCVDGNDVDGCMKKIKNGEADLITLDGGEIYIAGKQNLISPKYFVSTY